MRTRLLLLTLVAQAAFPSVTYTYDSAGRLVAANYGSAGTVTYQYDNAGHIISRQLVLPSKCDSNGDGVTNVADVQLIINEALGIIPAVNDLNGDGVVNVVDVQIVINAALGLGCTAI